MLRVFEPSCTLRDLFTFLHLCFVHPEIYAVAFLCHRFLTIHSFPSIAEAGLRLRNNNTSSRT